MSQSPRDETSGTGPPGPGRGAVATASQTSERTADPTADAPAHEPVTAAEPLDAAAMAKLAAPQVAMWIGPFRVVRVLGMGGMGTVYEAIDDRLERRVALKAIRPERRFDARLKARFMREARILSSLDHPSICRIHDYLEVDDAAYLVLEFIEGEPLGRARSRLTHAAKLRLAEQIAGVLVAAHAAGVVHRDLKPDNILVTSEHDAKVLDFGIARPAGQADGGEPGQDTAADLDADSSAATRADAVRAPAAESLRAGGSSGIRDSDSSRRLTGMITSPGDLVGTPMYMSPEQARGHEPTPASDVYAFGLVLAELFSGARPFDTTGGLDALLRRVERGERIPFQIRDRQLARLIGELTALAPSMRPTAAEARRRIIGLRGRTRRRVLTAVVSTIALLAIAGSIKYAVDLGRERTAAVAARNDAEDLIGFMTEELRDRLAPVGRLDVLGGVAERVIGYYADRDPATLSDAELHKYAKGLSLIGEVQLSRSDADPESAERAFTDAMRKLDRLVAHDPTDGERLKSLGAAHFWLGTIAYRRMDLDQAQAEYEAYLKIAEKLVALDADRAEWQLELAYAHSNLVHLFRQRGDLEASRRALDASLEAKRKVMAMQPGDGEAARSLANGLTYLSGLRERDGDEPGVEAALTEALAVLRVAAETSPRDGETAYRLVVVRVKRGEHFERRRESGAALAEYRAAQDTARELLSLDPSNAAWQREMGIAHRSAGRVLVGLDRIAEARLELAAGRRLLTLLVERDPGQTHWRMDLAYTELEVGRAEDRAGEPLVALEHVAAARTRFAEAAELTTEPGPREGIVIEIAGTHLLEGTIRIRLSQIEQAHAAWSEVPSVLEPVASDHLAARRDALLIESLLRLGRFDDARGPHARLTARGPLPAHLVTLARERGFVAE